VINKAFLHPWVREKMQELLIEGQRLGLAPIVTSTYRFGDTQDELMRRCRIAQPEQQGFPVKESPCSQHEWGFAFDANPTVNVPLGGGIPGRGGVLLEVFCKTFPEACTAREEGRDTAPFALGLVGRDIGLEWSPRDTVHFSAFTPGRWDPHMRSVWGLSCRTCTYPGGTPA